MCARRAERASAQQQQEADAAAVAVTLEARPNAVTGRAVGLQAAVGLGFDEGGEDSPWVQVADANVEGQPSLVSRFHGYAEHGGHR